MMNKQSRGRNPAIALIFLLLVLALIFSSFKFIEIAFHSEKTGEAEPVSTKTIERDGLSYFPRQDITVVMLLGIDQTGPVESSASYNNTGEADMFALLIFDESNETYSILMLNRDTMLDMPVLGVGGKRAGTAYGQLALAHTYGSGLADSCENIREAVSEFLCGLKIDYYASLNMDAISILTDQVGGVPVTVTDDFSEVDPSIPMGETTLSGEQALSFVQARRGVGNQMNVSRMERQQAYMEGLLEAFFAKGEQSESFAVQTYDALNDYMVTDCTATTMSTMMTRYADYTLSEILSPEGENVQGEEYMEFYADEEELDDLILRLFYAEKEL